MTSLLETRQLSVSFGGLHANDHVDIRIAPGTFVGLIGPNGAGKTTFIDAITGFTKPSGGAIIFDGRDVTDVSQHERARRGMVRTWQSIELFEDLSVEDNLLVAADSPRWHSVILDILRPGRALRAQHRVERALDLLGLSSARDELASHLSQGQRRLVGIARAIAAAPTLVLLDEPAAGLDSKESQRLGGQLRRLPGEGIAVLLVDHDMGLVMSACDYVYVLDFGRIIASGTPAEIRQNDEVIKAYLGSTISSWQHDQVAPPRGPDEE